MTLGTLITTLESLIADYGIEIVRYGLNVIEDAPNTPEQYTLFVPARSSNADSLNPIEWPEEVIVMGRNDVQMLRATYAGDKIKAIRKIRELTACSLYGGKLFFEAHIEQK